MLTILFRLQGGGLRNRRVDCFLNAGLQLLLRALPFVLWLSLEASSGNIHLERAKKFIAKLRRSEANGVAIEPTPYLETLP